MTSPPHALTTLAPTAGPRSAGDDFNAACSRRDIALLQDALAGMTKRDAVDHLAELFPWRTRRWFSRNLERLTSLDPEIFWRLTHADPTGEEACRRVMAS